MMKIALDAMGGDFAPRENIEGALLAARLHGIPIVLVGDEKIIRQHLSRSRFSSDLIEIVHAAESIDMHERATAAIRSRRQTSMRVALELLKEKKVSAVISPGHTGAFMATSLLILGRFPGIERPAIAGYLPTLRGACVILDLGANVECRISHLLEFAIMGEVYARLIEKKDQPTIGLLSNGEEPSKGTALLREAHEQFKSRFPTYLGFVESKDIFKGKVDVVVCDGFIGNIFLKTTEGVIGAVYSLAKQDIQKNLFSKLIFGLFYLLFKNTIKNLGRRFDYAEYGAAPLLGLDGLVFVCHGRSSGKAIKNAILTARKSVEEHLLENLKVEVMKHSQTKSEAT